MSFAMLLKSYSADAAYAQRLIASFHRFNDDGIHLFVVVPESDVPLFTSILNTRDAGTPTLNTTLLSENELGHYLVDEPVHGLRPGYINQEIIKLAFWELGLADNYFLIDSDAEFIRPFTVSDFMFDESTPYSVLVEDHELQVEPNYYQQYWISREASIHHIQELVGLDTRVVLTCHGHTVFSSPVLRSFVNDFLRPRGWTYRDALAESPYEFSWYNMWLQKSRVIDIHPREPWIKVFHNEEQHLEYVMRGITIADIARGYLGIVMNSSYSRDLGLIDAKASKPDSVARYLSYGELAKVAAAKVQDTARRRFQRPKG
jgi:hypothetical protein